MKKFLLLLSVVGNVALLVLVGSSIVGKNRAVATGPSAAGSTQSTPVASRTAAAGPVDTSDIRPAEWQEMTSGDLATQVARLRVAGFPESVLRTIVAAQLSEQYQARLATLRGSQPKTPYWQNDVPTDPKIRTAQRELSNEYNKQMTDLLGSTVSDDPMYLAQQRAQYGDLPREKIEQITRIQRDYNDLRQKLYDVAGMNTGPITITSDIQTKINQLEAEQRKDILALLTPQEAEDYELRSSSTASQMRSSLAAFQPNEQEFRTIFKFQKEFDELYNTRNLVALPSQEQQDFMRRRSDAQKELTSQIVAALGAERGAEYERTSDSGFQQVYRVVERLELPKEAATQVWETQKDITQRATALRTTGGPMNAAARNEQLAQLAVLAQEAEARVSAALGPRGLEVYKQYGGQWIQNLQPRPAAPAGGAGGAIRGGVIDTMWQIR